MCGSTGCRGRHPLRHRRSSNIWFLSFFVKFRDPSLSPHRCHSRAQRRISVGTRSRMTKCSSCADIWTVGDACPYDIGYLQTFDFYHFSQEIIYGNKNDPEGSFLFIHFRHLSLCHYKLIVYALFAHKSIMISDLRYLAAVKDQKTGRISQSWQSMGDGNSSSARNKLLEGILYILFRFR